MLTTLRTTGLFFLEDNNCSQLVNSRILSCNFFMSQKEQKNLKKLNMLVIKQEVTRPCNLTVLEVSFEKFFKIHAFVHLCTFK